MSFTILCMRMSSYYKILTKGNNKYFKKLKCVFFKYKYNTIFVIIMKKKARISKNNYMFVLFFF